MHLRKYIGRFGKPSFRERYESQISSEMKINYLSRRASQQSIPVAIAESHVATAKGRSRAVIELVVEAAMVRAVVSAQSESAMVSKLPRQE
jgi:hypothetical protein